MAPARGPGGSAGGELLATLSAGLARIESKVDMLVERTSAQDERILAIERIVVPRSEIAELTVRIGSVERYQAAVPTTEITEIVTRLGTIDQTLAASRSISAALSRTIRRLDALERAQIRQATILKFVAVTVTAGASVLGPCSTLVVRWYLGLH